MVQAGKDYHTAAKDLKLTPKGEADLLDPPFMFSRSWCERFMVWRPSGRTTSSCWASFGRRSSSRSR
eukprot:6301836-Pyramimonas_sp.AAC.1